MLADTFAAMRLHWLLPKRSGVPVLMYHRIWPGQRDGLTLTPEDLRAQWVYLKDEGYHCLSMEQFLKISRGAAHKPKKCFLLSFDDGYHNNLTYALPLLREFGWEATIFIITGTLDGSYDLGEGIDRKLTADELHSICGANISLGLHGYHHENFSQTDLVEIRKALQQSFEVFEKSGLSYHKVLAYPYGARPKGAGQEQLSKWLSAHGIKAAFRIGNRPQKIPAKDVYQLHRIDIRGEDSLEDFKIKLQKGKLKPF